MHISTMEDAFSLMGKTAIVTGGNRGIGLGIATAFAHQGANVAIFCRNEESANRVVAELSGKYVGKYAFYKTDITDYDNCKESIDAVTRDFRGLDILVNNAGIGFLGGILEMGEDLEGWFRCFNTDLHGAVRMTHIAASYMRDAGRGGRIINITSNAGEIVNMPLMTSYSAAKAALNQLTKCLAVELAPFGITVNAIAPGFTRSDLANEIPPEALDGVLRMIPMGRFGETVEVGALATYLASDASEIMTGAILTIDGGYSLPR